MYAKHFVRWKLVGMVAASAWLLLDSAGAADEEAARALARQSNCFKCHAIEKKKEAPPWREVAAKYKGKPEAD